MITNRTEYARQYYLKNKEKLKRQHSEYYQKHKSEIKQRFGEYNRRYYQQNKDRINKNRKRDRSYISNFHLKRKYGIDESYYNSLLNSQRGCCAICGKDASKYKRKFAVDHNHKSGQIRGLLCVKCNRGIGCFEETLELFDKAKEYIIKFSI